MGAYDSILDSVKLPRMYRVKRLFDSSHIADIQGAVASQVKNFPGIS